MTDRPILFSAPMVRALLDGTKTQTRRVVKPQPQPNGGAGLHPVAPYRNPRGLWAWVLAATGHGSGGNLFACPYGKPGDRLWVRETWTTHAFLDDIPPRDLTTRSLHYQADGVIKTGKLRPSIHMPRWASRITLDVTGVRVERLQGISADDAKAEGAPPSHQSIDRVSRELGYADFPRSWYAQLWEQINGPGSWDANPWVWVVSFKRVTP